MLFINNSFNGFRDKWNLCESPIRVARSELEPEGGTRFIEKSVKR